jgi:hypothetical protein
MEKIYKIIVDVIFTIVVLILSYLFFSIITDILTSDKLFSLDYIYILKIIIAPLLIFAAIIFIFTFETVISRFKLAVFAVAAAFLISQGFNIYSSIATIAIGLLLFIVTRLFNDDLNNFKRPSISRCMSSSLGLPVTLLSLIIVGSLFPLYSNFFAKDIKLNDKITSMLGDFSSSFASKDQSFSPEETVKNYAIDLLNKQNAPVNKENLQKVEESIYSSLGVNGQESDKVADLYKQMVISKITDFISNNKNMVLYGLLISAFIFLQTLLRFSTTIGILGVYIIEKFLNLFNINLIPDQIKPEE